MPSSDQNSQTGLSGERGASEDSVMLAKLHHAIETEREERAWREYQTIAANNAGGLPYVGDRIPHYLAFGVTDQTIAN